MRSGTTPGAFERDELRKAINQFRSALASAAVLSLVVNLLMLASPLFMMQIYDRVLSSRSMPTLAALTILVTGSFCIMAVLELIRSRLMIQIGAGIDQALRGTVFDAVVAHALKRTPNVDGQPLRDIEAIRQYTSGPGLFALFEMPWMPVYLAVNYLLHPYLGHLTLAGMVLLFLLALANEVLTRRPIAEAAAASQRSHAIAEEGRRAAEVLASMGMQLAYRRRWSSEYEKAQRLQMAAADRASLFTSSTKALRLFLQSAALAVAAALAISGEVSAGTIIAASIVMSRALSPVEQATSQWGNFQNARRAYGRLRQTLQAVASDLPKPVRLPEPKGYISVEQLIVLAPGRTEAIISGVTFSLAPGDGLGIIGPSGSGKSTLIRAIVGVWPVAKGSVRIDGATVQQWPPEQIGRAIGYVPQDVELFSGTVAENIARFEPNPDPELIVEAAKRANVHDLILRLPDGYRTDLGESGSKLSAGQRQRIALARALYGNPVLLVLDEPNSNLDSGGEQALAATIAEMRKRGVTVIIVAHRRSALAMVDRLLFLQDGRQVAFGPKDEVLRIATQSVAAAQASSKLVSVNPANLGPRPKSGTVAR